MKFDLKIKKCKRGIAALMIVVIIGATTLILAFSASFLGLGELDMGYTAQRGQEVAALADGCMEEALYQVRLDINYAGEILNVDGNSCIISILSNGNDMTITVGASIGNYGEKIQSNITLNGNVITLNSWQELDT